MKQRFFYGVVLLFVALAVAGLVMSADKAGEVRAVKGTASIISAGTAKSAAVRDAVFLADTLETGRDSRMKVLFVDDSLMTMGENSRLIVKEYVLGDDKRRGQSVFNLADGTVRAFVGKNKFEIRTPTAVAAARGTILIPWVNNVNSSCVAVLKGVVDVSHADPAFKGSKATSGGYMLCAEAGKPLGDPVPTPEDLLKRKIADTTVDETPGVEDPHGGPDDEKPEGGPPGVPPIEQEPILPQRPMGYGYGYEKFIDK